MLDHVQIPIELMTSFSASGHQHKMYKPSQTDILLVRNYFKMKLFECFMEQQICTVVPDASR